MSVESADPARLAQFWADLLGWAPASGPLGGAALMPADDTGFGFQFLPSHLQKSGQNERHFHLTSSSLQDQEQTVAKALGLGARHIDVGQRPDEGHVVLADPEGNEFCVIEPGNGYLADCGFMAEVTCAGSRTTGHFWAEALGWPLVWNQGLQTAIQSPQGGPKVSWDEEGMATTWQNRHRFVLAPGDGDPDEEASRLVALGATRVGPGQADAGVMVMADPDGREFFLLTPR
ncbi:MAG TPA: VOC family protein [Propionibacteriaceae bacterium]|nr:VOC family protein [Propionibacteriaceae bacterium]